MIIVVEGPDFAGKSTLVKKLEKHHKSKGRTVNVVHTTQPDPEDHLPLFVRYVDDIKYAIEVQGDDGVVIFDRLHIGEAIYGPRYRGESRISELQMEVLDQLLTDIGALKVFVDTADADLLHRFRGDRGEDFVKDEDALLQIADEYRQLLGNGTNRLHGWIRWTNAYERMLGIAGAE